MEYETLEKMTAEERLAAGYLFMDSIDGEPAQFIPWSPPEADPSPEVVAAAQAAASALIPKKVSPAYEIMEAVQEYYRAQGTGVPSADMKGCLELVKLEKAPKAPEPELPPAKPARPEYGSKEFWAAYWAKKRAAGHVTKKDAKASGAAAATASKK
jgi:hypothetical protein